MDPNAIAAQPIIITLSAGVFTSNVDFGYKTISLKLVSGAVTYTGQPGLAIQGVVPPTAVAYTPIALDDTGFFIQDEDPIDGLIVDASAGVVIIAVTK